jgi:hypothetical protein
MVISKESSAFTRRQYMISYLQMLTKEDYYHRKQIKIVELKLAMAK